MVFKVEKCKTRKVKSKEERKERKRNQKGWVYIA
jgi:hypothetical protein